MKTVIGLSLEKSIVQKIDSMRGLIPRSRFVEELIKQKFGDTQ
jgi:metal-responsive CopG/Arc/MetJ family transcriptional regulator